MKTIAVDKLDGYDRVIECPGDKSVSIRAALMCALLLDGYSEIENLSDALDVKSALRCVSSLGATVSGNDNGDTRDIGGAAKTITKIIGAGDRQSGVLDCGNSATTARLLMGILAGKTGEFVIDGDDSLRSRPMLRVTEPLRAMGADITDNCGKLPVTVRGAKLHGISYQMPIASAQVKSAILLAGLHADGQTRVIETIKTRDHTERLIEYFGGDITVDGNAVSVRGGKRLKNRALSVAGDPSSAAYPICVALALGGRCTVKNVGINPTRTRYIDILRTSGANIAYSAVKDVPHANESICDISVKKSELSPFTIKGDDAAAVIDEIPVLCALACFIRGTSVIDGAGELRVKESDRIAAAVAALKALGADITETENGMTIRGGKPLSFGTVCAASDHRIAMAAAVAGACGNGVRIFGGDCVDVSYPDFYREVVR